MRLIVACLSLLACEPSAPNAQRVTVHPSVPVTDEQALGQETTEVPVSPSRAKFPLTEGKLVDAIEYANRLVNKAITYTTDDDHYGVEDKWVSFPSDGKGDCEDYATTKAEVLRRAGWPMLSATRIVFVYVHDVNGGGGHAILAVRLAGGEVAYLDNNYDALMTRAELEANGYEFFDW